MFKSTFMKYMAAFSIVLLISFIVLSSIVTTVIRSHVQEEQEAALVRTSVAIANHVGTLSYADLATGVASGVITKSIFPLINSDNDIHIVIADLDGKILLTTVNAQVTEFGRMPITGGDLGSIDISKFSQLTMDEQEYLSFTGKMRDIIDEKIQVCAKKVIKGEKSLGYAVSFVSTEMEDSIVQSAKTAITNNALWIMLAAAIAIYFITERIINPLKTMTVAAKKFAKGDFSSRVAVYGKDEVAELGEAFNNMTDSLDRFEKTRNSFLASVAHDLRTPMTTISGFIDGITSGAIPPEKHDYYLGVISSEVHRLSRLVSDLLDLSRLESGEKKFNMTTFDVAEVARIILISFEQKIEEKKLDVIFEADEDVMPVVADKDAIHQVLYNLCHNAIKFSKVGGKLAISITRIENKKIRISVYDEGEGIGREELPFVFDRFYKTDKSRGLDKTGVGLGLYICKTIVDAHGERIRAESPNQDGAEFWFTLAEGESGLKRRSSSSDN